MGWQLALISIALIAAVILLGVSCKRIPPRKPTVRFNPMFDRHYSEKHDEHQI